MPGPPKDWSGDITLYMSRTLGLVRVEPAYFEPLIRRLVQDGRWMATTTIQDLCTGKIYSLRGEYIEEAANA